MKKNSALFILIGISCIFFGSVMQAQSILTGVIVDSITGLGIEGSTISLQGNDIDVKRVTDAKGKFSITGINTGRYLVTVSAIGYFMYKDTLLFDKHQNILRIAMRDTTIELAEVRLGSKRIITEPGKMTFIINNTDIRTSSSVLDLLGKTPYLAVETDGNITIKGKINAEVYLDSKPLLDNKTLTSLSPKMIQKIEIISNPGATSDIEGKKGIVNIITKKNWDGYFGNISGQLGTRSSNEINGFFSIKSRKVEFNLSGGTNYYKRPFKSDTRWEDLVSKNSFLQYLTATNRGLNSYLTSGINITIDSLTKASYKGFIAIPDYKTSLTTNYYYPSVTKGDSLGHIRNGLDNSHRFSMINNLSWSKRLAGYKDNFSISLRQYSYHLDKKYLNSWVFPIPIPDYNQYNTLKFNELAAQFEFQTFRLLKARILAGIKYTTRNYSSDFYSEKFNAQLDKFEPDASFSATNNFDGHQRVGALYASISKKVNKVFSFDAGSRIENTVDEINFGNIYNVKKNYVSFLPSLSILFDFNNEKSFQVSFSRRISRPGVTYLNPFLNTGRDFRNISNGNPGLKPEIINRVEMSYTCTKESYFISIDPYITFRSGLITANTIFLSGDTLLTTYQNLNRQTDMGISVSGSKTLSKKLKINIGAGIERNYFRDQVADKQGSNYYVTTSLSFVLSADLLMSGSYQFRSAPISFQGKEPAISSVEIAVQKIFFKKLTLAVTASNFFSNNSVRKYLVYNQVISQLSVNDLHLDVYAVRLKFEFGKVKNRTFTSTKINSNDLKDDK
jgi:Outer membrane protein beta-barrel family/CarboxypepD_reg-like domain